MPPSKSAPTRSSQRRNSSQEDTPARTRAGRGGKAAPSSRPEGPEMVPTMGSPSKLSPTATRKTTRSASNISGNSFEAPPEVYASFEHPLLMVFGLSREFFETLKKHHGKLPKERKAAVPSLSHDSTTPDDGSELEQDSDQDSDHDLSLAAPRGGRGRGRGGRAGRARGSRGRGRAGRARGGSTRPSSPSRARPPARNAAPMFPLTEEDDDQPSNQSTADENAKPTPHYQYGEKHRLSINSDDEDEQAVDDGDSEDDGSELMQGQHKSAAAPKVSAPLHTQESTTETAFPAANTSNPGPRVSKKAAGKMAIPKISLSKGSAPQTPRDSVSTPAESAVPTLLDPEDDMLSDSDLPEPFVEDAPWPREADCEDRADYLLQTRFKPMTDLQSIIASLTKFPAAQRSTETLYALAENAQNILKAWQDEYLMLDARTAPHMHPPKKACNGGRIPTAPEVYEDMKEADLYGYIYDPKKLPGCQDPWAQRPGAEKGGRRELRTRRTRDMLESAMPSEEDEEVDQDGRPSKRQRRATRKFDGTDTGTGTGTNTPKKNTGWGGARKKGVSKFANSQGSETPEPEGRAAKRARTAATNLLHQRIQEMREESAGGSSGEEGSSLMDVSEQPDPNPKRGRPAGSKNVARRSDFGVKKGPRKKTSAAGTPVPSSNGPSGPPPALSSMSEGQGQFTIDDQPQPGVPLLPPASNETVFQSTARVPPSHEISLVHPNESSTPDAYMLTAPLSQYTGGYVEDTSPASGSRRKPRVKSEKRSQSMTIWWAERKARKREQDERNGTPIKTPNSRSNSVSGKGPRNSVESATGATPQPTQSESQQPSPIHHQQHPPHHAPPEPYLAHYAQPPGHPQQYMYVSGPAPPHHMMMQHSPLAALPSGPFPSYPSAHAPPLHSHHNAAYGARALAPAPMPHQHHPSYPSPYGPQSPVGKRSQSSSEQARNGQLPLAPAPSQHYSPYAPLGAEPNSGSGMDRQFKVMIPGPQAERRESR